MTARAAIREACSTTHEQAAQDDQHWISKREIEWAWKPVKQQWTHDKADQERCAPESIRALREACCDTADASDAPCAENEHARGEPNECTAECRVKWCECGPVDRHGTPHSLAPAYTTRTWAPRARSSASTSGAMGWMR